MKVLASFFLGGALATVLPVPHIENEDGLLTAYLFERPQSVEEQKKVDSSFAQVFAQFEHAFNNEQHQSFLESFDRLLDSNQYSGFANAPVCDNAAPNALAVRASGAQIKTFPGGVTGRLLNFDLSKLADKLADRATSSAGASGGIGGVIAMQGLMTASTLIQGLVSSALHVIPPQIPPPAWNNQPLTCMPMVTGHNCFGAVFHPITASDFALSSSTDSMLSGYIASFPTSFADKVGPAPDSVYKACFLASMSMHCASIFPMCTAPQTGNDPTTNAPQRAPMCFQYCISTLVACPGFWIDDIAGQCTDVSVPPACSTAFFWRLDMLPPQYTTFEASTATQRECPGGNIDIPADLVKGLSDSGAAAAAGGAGSVDTIKLPSPA